MKALTASGGIALLFLGLCHFIGYYPFLKSSVFQQMNKMVLGIINLLKQLVTPL